MSRGCGWRPGALTDRLEIRIRDNGGGIPPDVVDKIFNPFFTTKPTDQGTGLGLSLSNDIVRQHGGDIRVDSEPDAFTEMIIELPAKRGPAPVLLRIGFSRPSRSAPPPWCGES